MGVDCSWSGRFAEQILGEINLKQQKTITITIIRETEIGK